MKFAVICFFAGLAATGWSQENGPLTDGGSLLSQGNFRSWISARTASAKGDLLTIVINESVTGKSTQNTSTSKADATSTSASVLPVVSEITGWLLNGTAKKVADAVLGANSTGATSTVKGAGSTDNTTSMVSTVSVKVKEVLPNGNLIVEGVREIKTNGENVSLIVSGIVRRDDVGLDNTVQSKYVADLKVMAQGKGVVADRQRTGFLTQVLAWLF